MFDILGMAYSPVRVGLSVKQKWIKTVEKKDIDDKTFQRLEAYFGEIWKSRRVRAYDGEFDVGATGRNTHKLLDEIVREDLSDAESWKRFKDRSRKLAAKLRSEMDKRSSLGYLFVILCMFEKQRYCCLLKLDLRDEVGHPTLDKHTRDIAFESITDALPRPRNIQKGAIFPLPSDPTLPFRGDIKVVQYDMRAAYFDGFLDLRRRAAPKRQLPVLVNILGQIKKGAGQDPLTPRDRIDLVDGIKRAKGEKVKLKDLEGTFKDILGKAYDPSSLK